MIDSFRRKQLEEEIEELQRYTADTVNGNYIPKDIHDCVEYLANALHDSIKNKIQAGKHTPALDHRFGAGVWIRNNWIRPATRLTKYFHDLKLIEPDNISSTIINCFRRYLKGEDLKFKEEIQRNILWHEERRQEEENFLKSAFQRYYRVGDTLYYGYRNSGARFDYDNTIDKKCLSKAVILKRRDKQRKVKIRLLTICEKEGIILASTRPKIFDEQSHTYEYPSDTKFAVMKPGDTKWIYLGDYHWLTSEDIQMFRGEL